MGHFASSLGFQGPVSDIKDLLQWVYYNWLQLTDCRYVLGTSSYMQIHLILTIPWDKHFTCGNK